MNRGAIRRAAPTPLAGRRKLLGERMTRSWSHIYTHGLPTEIALARRAELAADVHDQQTDIATASRAAASRAIAARMILGVLADLSWRSEQARAVRSDRRKEIVMNATSTTQRAIALALGAVIVTWGVVMSVGSAAAQRTGSGAAAFFWVLFVIATLIGLAGFFRLARRRPGGAPMLAVAALATSFAFFWMPPIWITGCALAGYFLTLSRHQRSTAPPAVTSPVA